MPFQIEHRGNDGGPLGETVKEAPDRPLELPALDDDSLPLLRSIDPYSDTYFSQYQMRWLVPELETLRERSSDASAALVDEILVLARRCAELPQTHLVFLGD